MVAKEQAKREILHNKLLEVSFAQTQVSRRNSLKLIRSSLVQVEQSAKGGGKIFADALSAKLILDDDKDDQDILDQHVSRVWSDLTPHRSPGNLSPCTQQLQQRRKNAELAHIAGGSEYFAWFLQTFLWFSTFSTFTGVSSMRVPKAMPETNMRKKPLWGSMNTDSGISLFSSDTMTTSKLRSDQMSISGSSSSSSRPSRIPETISGNHAKMAMSSDDIRRCVGRFIEFCSMF